MSAFKLLVRNPGAGPEEVGVDDVAEARHRADQMVAPGGEAELLDEAAGRTVWIRRDGGELDPGG